MSVTVLISTRPPGTGANCYNFPLAGVDFAGHNAGPMPHTTPKEKYHVVERGGHTAKIIPLQRNDMKLCLEINSPNMWSKASVFNKISTKLVLVNSAPGLNY